MATVRKLAADEIAILRRRGARVDLTAYQQALAELEIGEWGLIELEADEKLPTIKRRYALAAKSQGKGLAFRRLRRGTLPFEVRALSDMPAQRVIARTKKAATPAAATLVKSKPATATLVKSKSAAKQTAGRPTAVARRAR